MAKKNHVNEAAVAIQKNSSAIKRAAKGMQGYERMGEGLANLNTMRGGTKGFKGFVMEEMEAGRASALGRHTEVINNNGAAGSFVVAGAILGGICSLFSGGD